jgi:hypothetical protein
MSRTRSLFACLQRDRVAACFRRTASCHTFLLVASCLEKQISPQALPYHGPAYGSQQPAPTQPEPCRDTKRYPSLGVYHACNHPCPARKQRTTIHSRRHARSWSSARQPACCLVRRGPQALTSHWEGNAPVGNTNEAHNADM